MTSELIARMPTAAFAFRGYNVTNLGKTPELLEHPVYGPTFEKHLKAASEIFEALWETELVQPTFVHDFPTEVSPLSKQRADDPGDAVAGEDVQRVGDRQAVAVDS